MCGLDRVSVLLVDVLIIGVDRPDPLRDGRFDLIWFGGRSTEEAGPGMSRRRLLLARPLGRDRLPRSAGRIGFAQRPIRVADCRGRLVQPGDELADATG